jgi:hypothetical protein
MDKPIKINAIHLRSTADATVVEWLGRSLKHESSPIMRGLVWKAGHSGVGRREFNVVRIHSDTSIDLF